MEPLSWALWSLLPNYGHHRSQAGVCRIKSWIQEKTIGRGAGQRKKGTRESFPSLNGSVTDTSSDFKQLLCVLACLFGNVVHWQTMDRS